MNYPGHPEGNWAWRFSWDQVLPWQTIQLSKMTTEHGRTHPAYLPR